MSETERKNIRHKITYYLSKREYSVYELTQKLSQQDFETDLIVEVLSQFSARGIQSDQRYALAQLRNCMSKGQGYQRFKLLMQQQQVSQQDMQMALDEVNPDWFALAWRVKVKKFGANQAEDLANKQKQQRFLSYRGFNHEQINHALEYSE